MFTQVSECEFPISINMVRYKLEEQIIEKEKEVDNNILEEFGCIFESSEQDKNEIESQENMSVHADIYKAYKPITVSIRDYKLNNIWISEVIGDIHKKYKFHLPLQKKFILLDEDSGNLLTGEIVGQMPYIDKFDWLYKSMRQNVFIPMMCHCLFNITREYSKVKFYDFFGYYGATISIKEDKPKEYAYQ